MAPALTELVVGDEASAWAAAGFTVDDDRVVIGGVSIRLVGSGDPRGRGVLCWALTGLTDADTPLSDLDGIATTSGAERPGSGGADAAPVHPNGTVAVDHVVMITPDLDRTIGRLEASGLEVRRIREVGTPEAPRRQVFFWIGEPILELVGPAEPAGDGPSRIYGLALTVADIDRTATELGERVGRVKDAVQPGRRITTLRHKDLDITVPVAFMTPHVSPEAKAGEPGA